MFSSCGLLRRALAATAAAAPSNYSNTPYQKRQQYTEEDDGMPAERRHVGGGNKKKDSTQFTTSSSMVSSSLLMSTEEASMRYGPNNTSTRTGRGGGLSLVGAALPPPVATAAPVRSTFINPSRAVTSFNGNHKIRSFRHAVRGSSDLSMRSLQFLQLNGGAASPVAAASSSALENSNSNSSISRIIRDGNSLGDRIRDSLSCRWAAKFYGQVTFGPRNFPYPSSRWLARRFKMKKHKIVKRFRFRRYKLAAVANLPFAKMIRVGMLPELKSSKSKKGDAVEAGLSSQLVSAAKSSTGGKIKGKRSRPKSKYQV